MSSTLNTDGTLTIESLSLVDFLPEIEKAIHNGWLLDINNNLGVPQQIGYILTVTMFSGGDIELTGEDEEFQVPASPEMVKALQEALKVGFDPTPFIGPVQEVKPSDVQEAALSTTVVQPVKLDGRRKKS